MVLFDSIQENCIEQCLQALKVSNVKNMEEELSRRKGGGLKCRTQSQDNTMVTRRGRESRLLGRYQNGLIEILAIPR
jgi:hypothetical protein